MIYFFGIIFSTVLFSVQFLFQKLFQKQESSTPEISVACSVANSLFAIVFLLLKGGMSLAFSPFSFFMAFVKGCNAVLAKCISLKVMEYADLSVFSLFTMLGGMLLPFSYSIFLGGEAITWQKAVCVAVIVIALVFQVVCQKKDVSDGNKNKKIAFILYATIFVSNGLDGVFAKIHQSAPAHLTVEASSYTLLERLISFSISMILFSILLLKGRRPNFNRPVKSLSNVALTSILNTVANLILLTALLHVDASVQYPIVTGGVVIFSLVLEFFAGSRPKLYTVLTAVISFVGLCFLAF